MFLAWVNAGNSPFPLQRLQIACSRLLFVPEHIDLVRVKLVRKWVWLDSRITTNILAMPGPVAVCILESEKPTGLEIWYV